MTGKCSLIWDDFQKNMAARLYTVLQNHDLVDVTLLSQDSKKVLAHKVILSSGSVFFKEVLTNNCHPHPLIYLKGVDNEVLQAVVDFLYQGQVEVRQEVVQAFMATAKDLKVEGLHDVEEEGESSQEGKGTKVGNSDVHVDPMSHSEVEKVLVFQENETRDLQLLSEVDEMFNIKGLHEKTKEPNGNVREMTKEGIATPEQNKEESVTDDFAFYLHCNKCEYK